MEQHCCTQTECAFVHWCVICCVKTVDLLYIYIYQPIVVTLSGSVKMIYLVYVWELWCTIQMEDPSSTVVLTVIAWLYEGRERTKCHQKAHQGWAMMGFDFS